MKSRLPGGSVGRGEPLSPDDWSPADAGPTGWGDVSELVAPVGFESDIKASLPRNKFCVHSLRDD